MGARERLFSCSGLWFVLLLARPSVRPPARPLTQSNIGRPFIHLHFYGARLGASLTRWRKSFYFLFSLPTDRFKYAPGEDFPTQIFLTARQPKTHAVMKITSFKSLVSRNWIKRQTMEHIGKERTRNQWLCNLLDTRVEQDVFTKLKASLHKFNYYNVELFRVVKN